MAGPPSIDELAARIAELEAAGTDRSRRPRRDAAVAKPSEAAPGGDAPVVAAEGAAEAPLPTRDVNDDRLGPAVVSLEGQAAHDDALGVAPASAAPQQRRPQRKREPKAELAFAGGTPHQQAIDLAYKLVSRREHTVKQVRDKLAAKECSPAAIDAAVQELGRYGFIDDERYARLFAEDKRRLQHWGARRIRMKLQQDGIARELLDALFADDEAALEAPTELESALELLRRKQPDLSDVRVKSRMVGMLARKGIASPTVFQALRQHQQGEAGSASGPGKR